MTQKFWVLNEQYQAVAWVVQLGQNRVPHVWLLNMGSGGYDNHVTDHQQHSGVAQIQALPSFMSWPNMNALVVYRIPLYYGNCRKWLTDNGDLLQSDEQSS